VAAGMEPNQQIKFEMQWNPINESHPKSNGTWSTNQARKAMETDQRIRFEKQWNPINKL